MAARPLNDARERQNADSRARNVPPFTMLESQRGHALEYGDTLLMPCNRGAVIHTASVGHISSCQECKGSRTFLDTWHTENERRKEINNRVVGPNVDIEPVPALTFAGATELVGMCNPPLRSLAEVLKMDMGWNPYELGFVDNRALGEQVRMDRSFVEIWRGLTADKKNSMVRPDLPSLPSFTVTAQRAAAVPAKTRALNGMMEAYAYILETAVNDGRLNRTYIDSVLANFGIVPAGSALLGANNTAAGYQVQHVYADIMARVPLDAGDADAAPVETDVAGYSMSPRKRRRVVTPNEMEGYTTRQQRLANFPGPGFNQAQFDFNLGP